MRRIITFFLLFSICFLSGNCSNGLKESVQPGGPKKKIVRQQSSGEWLLFGSNTQSYRSTDDYFELTFDTSPTWTYDGEEDGLHFVNKGSPVVYKNYLFVMTSYYSGDPPYSTSNEIIGSWFGRISDQTDSQANLACIDRTNGSLKWIYPKPGYYPLLKPYLTPAISKKHNLVYVGTESMVFALDIHSGELKWKSVIKSSLVTNHHFNSPILWQGIIKPDTVLTEYIFYGAQSINCLKAEDGTVRWSTDVVQHEGEMINTVFSSSPVISGSTSAMSLYVAENNGKVFCFDIQNGKKRWAYNAGGSLGTTNSLLLYKNCLYYVAWDATKRVDMKFCCLDISGTAPVMAWNYNLNFVNDTFTPFSDVSPICLLQKNRDEALLYFGTKDGKLYCFNHMYLPSNNRERSNVAPVWINQMNGSIIDAPIIFGNHNPTAKSSENTKPRLIVPLSTLADNVDDIYIVDPFKTTSNPILWSANLDEILSQGNNELEYNPLTLTSPCVAGDSIYIACTVGVVHRFGP